MYSTSLTSRDMQIRTKTMHHLAQVRVAFITKPINNRTEHGEKEPFNTVGGNVNW